jgi:hypothetical protein
VIRDEETGWVEASVSINGESLSFAEAMSLRVAVSSFRMSVNDDATRRLLGENLADGYDTHLRKIELLMIRGAK